MGSVSRSENEKCLAWLDPADDHLAPTDRVVDSTARFGIGLICDYGRFGGAVRWGSSDFALGHPWSSGDCWIGSGGADYA